MKRFVQFGGVLLALGMLLASCNIGMGDAQVSGDSVRSTSNVEGITLTIDKIGNTGRTILPADWNDGTAEKLTYVLLVKKAGTTGYETKKTFSYSELKNGTAVVNLDLIAWDLKLIGYITETSGTGADTTKACLAAELLNEDFSTGKKSVNFDLKPVLTNEDGSPTQATGDVDVTIAWLTTKPKRLEFGIYDLPAETDEIVEDEGRTSAKFSELKTDASFAIEGTAHEYSFQQTNVPAGMYKFAAVFYNAATGGEVIGYYIDYLYVDGGNLSKETVNYGDKFNTIPENPTWLAVETVFVPQEGASTITANNWYYAKFHWNDKSNNETGFELVLNDGTKDYVVSSEEDDDSLISDKWYDGTDETTFNATTNPNTLDAGRTWVVLKLKTETLYTAKIRAINKYTPDFDDTDDDDFCDNLNRNGDGQGRTYAPIVPDGTDATAKKQFGMFTVNYDLNGGNVTKLDKSTTANTVTNYVVGFNYHSEQQDLMTDDTLAYPHVSKTGSVFDHWEDTANSNARIDVLPAKQKDNLALAAVWGGSDVSVSVTFPSYADAKDVKIAADQNSDNTVVFKYNKDTNPSVTVTAGASLTSPAFELTEVGDNGKAVTSGTNVAGSAWTWTPSKEPTPGFYCLQITGTYKDAGSGRTLTLCGNIYINVEN